MKLVITYQDSENNSHQDEITTSLDTAYLVNRADQETQPNESEFLVYLRQFYENCGCDHVVIKEVG
jgi:hypothetical protein